MVVLPHYDLFPVIFVGCCLVTGNFPYWVPDLPLVVTWTQVGVFPGSPCGSCLGPGSGWGWSHVCTWEVPYGCREGFCSGSQHVWLHFCLLVSQLSSADCPLGAFISWVQISSMWFSCWRFQLSQPSWGSQCLTTVTGSCPRLCCWYCRKCKPANVSPCILLLQSD
jgi:hypothetical protein